MNKNMENISLIICSIIKCVKNEITQVILNKLTETFFYI